MESQSGKPSLIVIVGQTASGKSALALEVAERWNGEIIAADSRTIYRGMDIGTAKPTATDRRRVPHHLVDIRDPDQPFTAKDFQAVAQEAIEDITSRGKLPLLVGGTGLYIDAVLFDFHFPVGFDPVLRKSLEQLSVDDLQKVLQARGLALPHNTQNPRHLIRSIEIAGQAVTRESLRSNTLLLGLAIDPSELEQRITERVDTMIAAGLEQEARELAARFGWDCPPLKTIGYQEWRPLPGERRSNQEIRQAIITHTKQYAKRQKTWFKRNQSIQWIRHPQESVDLLTSFLSK